MSITVLLATWYFAAWCYHTLKVFNSEVIDNIAYPVCTFNTYLLFHIASVYITFRIIYVVNITKNSLLPNLK